MVASRTVLIDDSDSHIRYYGTGWIQESPGSYDDYGNFGPTYQGTIHSTNSGGDLVFSFKGTSVNVMGTTNVGHPNPSWDCYVDKEKIQVTKPYVSPENNWVLCSQDNIPDGDHELTVNVTSGGIFAFDYIEYTPSSSVSLGSSVVKVGYTDPSFRFSDGWQQLGGAILANQPGMHVEFDFTGKALSWVGYIAKELATSPANGTYSVDHGTPIFYKLAMLSQATTSQYYQTFFTTQDLPVGHHTILVTHNGNSSQIPLTLNFLYISNATSTALSTPAKSSKPMPGAHKSGMSIGPIIGGVIGGIAFVGLVLGFFLFRRRKRSRPAGGYDLSEPATFEPRHIPVVTPFADYSPLQVAAEESDLTSRNSMPQLSSPGLLSRSSTDWSSSGYLPHGTATSSRVSRKQQEAVSVVQNDPAEVLVHEDSGIRMSDMGTRVEEVPPLYTAT